MIARTIITSVFLLFLYSVFLFLRRPQRLDGQHQWQDNIIKAQDYLYNTGGNKNLSVIIGSSLSCRFVMDSLPNNFYNLSFGGQSVFDGLAILLRSGKIPKKVFIEINMIKRDETSEFINSLFTPFLYSVKQNLIGLQEKNQPVTYLGNYLAPRVNKYLIKGFSEKISHSIFKSVASKDFKKNAEFLARPQEMFGAQIKEFNTPFEESVINRKFTFLKEEVNQLRKKGAEVVFFEMPMYSCLEHTAQMETLRTRIHKTFPPAEYPFITAPAYSDYQTTDGLHLATENAIKYSLYFRNSVFKNSGQPGKVN